MSTETPTLIEWMERTTTNIGLLVDVGENLSAHIRRLYRIVWFLLGALVASTILAVVR